MLQHCLLCMLGQERGGDTKRPQDACRGMFRQLWVMLVPYHVGHRPEVTCTREAGLGVLCGQGLIIDASGLSSP